MEIKLNRLYLITIKSFSKRTWPDYLTCGCEVYAAYRHALKVTYKQATTFLGLPVVLIESVPFGEIWFIKDGEIVGKISGLLEE